MRKMRRWSVQIGKGMSCLSETALSAVVDNTTRRTRDRRLYLLRVLRVGVPLVIDERRLRCH